MLHRATNVSKILSLFKQNSRWSLTEIAAALSISPSVAKDFCHDLVKSGIITEVKGANSVYVATDKLLMVDAHIYDMIGELSDDLELPQEVVAVEELPCIKSVEGFCGDSLKKVPCNGTTDKVRCYRWVK